MDVMDIRRSNIFCITEGKDFWHLDIAENGMYCGSWVLP